jgi:alanine-glyoxylate transaminase/serine-glyoxylate transaminase/serine-pyruvate transaminase
MTKLPRRLLLGPGPSNSHPDVLAAMTDCQLGHLDPAFLDCVDALQTRLRRLFGTANAMTIPLSATGSGGMETCFQNLVEPGDDVLVGVAGVFGERMCEVAMRQGARVARVDAAWGSVLDDDAMIDAIARVRPSLVAFVHAETSTGAHQPVEAIARAARDAGALVVLDCVTSLGGVPVSLDAWGIDAAYSGTQKCLSCPPGLSPASFAASALERVARRKSPVPSWYFDLNLLGGYFGERRVYHHTAPIAAIAGLAEALRRIEAEGIDARIARHRGAAQRLVTGLERLGFEPVVAAEHRLPMLTSVRVPERVARDGEAVVRRRLLDRHDIEVGGGLGKFAGSVWRIGLMGENARDAVVDRLLGALETELGGNP